MQNIGVAFVKMAQFTDAVTSFEHIMAEKASFQTGMWNKKGLITSVTCYIPYVTAV